MENGGEGKAWSEWQVHSVGHAQPPCFCPLIFLSATPTSVISDHWCISRRTWLGFFSSGFNHQKVPCFSRSSCPERTQVASRKASGRSNRDPGPIPAGSGNPSLGCDMHHFIFLSPVFLSYHLLPNYPCRASRSGPSPPSRLSECNRLQQIATLFALYPASPFIFLSQLFLSKHPASRPPASCASRSVSQPSFFFASRRSIIIHVFGLFPTHNPLRTGSEPAHNPLRNGSQPAQTSLRKPRLRVFHAPAQ